MFRTVLVHTDCSHFPKDRVATAIDVARAFDATLIGVAAGMPVIPYAAYSAAAGGAYLGPELVELDRERLAGDFARAHAAFSEATSASGVETEWEEMLMAPSRALSTVATSADLLVLGAGDARMVGNEGSLSTGEVLVKTGRPALLVPEGCREVRTGSALVAWKDSVECQRAIADALPFLKRAAGVTVLAIEEEPDEVDSLARAAGFLVRHGIPANTRRLKPEGSVPEQLVAFARDNGVDLIVAGAYGHTRLREWVFGGVTRELLLRTPVPCLLSH